MEIGTGRLLKEINNRLNWQSTIIVLGRIVRPKGRISEIARKRDGKLRKPQVDKEKHWIL